MPTPDRLDAIRPVRRFVAAVLVALVAAAGALLPAATAAAADIPGAVTSVTTDKTSYGWDDRIKLSFTWAVSDSAVAGDEFTLDLPDELKATSLATFPLRDSAGAVVAWGTWSGKTVHVTLTDYVDTHDGVGGTGFVTVAWDKSVVPTTGEPLTLEFESNAIEVEIGPKPADPIPCTENCPPPPAPKTERGLGKSGWWADGSYEGTRDPANNIGWTISLPGSPEGFAGPIHVVDTPAAGSIVECSTLKLTTQLTLESGAVKTDVDADRYTVDCAPGGFTITLDAIAPTEFIAITYRGTITDQLSGAYGNKVTVDIPGIPGEKSVTIRRTAAGGDGGGVQSVSVGDLVWLDTDSDGLQDDGELGIPGVVLVLTGPGGGPVTDVDGHVVEPVATDADGLYSFDRLPVLPAGQHYTVTIDDAESADALDGLLPTTPGVGPARDVDSSTGSAESVDLTVNGARDPSLDFGFVGLELPTLPLPGDPELAFTGVDVTPMALGALAAALLGVALVGVGGLRRARRQHRA